MLKSFGNKVLNLTAEDRSAIIINLKDISGNISSHSLFDSHYHYRMAATHYDKSIKLHSAGDDYKKAINDILYLEDDLSDASYHFGAAMDRYLMVNGVLHEHFKECNENDSDKWNSPDNFL